MTVKVRVAAGIVLAALLPAMAGAQARPAAPSTRVSGRVVDAAGVALPGATFATSRRVSISSR
jgi:hypothetical protein